MCTRGSGTLLTTRGLPLMLAALGGALGLYAVSIAIWVPDSLTLPAPVHVAIGWSFVGAGTVAWLRRPDNRTGLLMTVTGVVWFGRDFDWMHTWVTTQADVLASNLFVALVAHQLVVFPEGRARTRLERILVVAAYTLATLGYLVTLLGSIANVIVDLLAAAVALAILMQLVAKWRRASPPRRRALAPVIWTGPTVLAVVLVMLALDSGGPWPAPVEAGLHWVTLCFVAIPVAFLAGLLRTQLHRGAVAELVVELSQALTPAEVRDALARTLRDPSLEIVYWLPDRACYVDLSGQAADMSPGPNRKASVLDRNGEPLAALLHDPSLIEEADLVQAAGAAARLALENARLQAELRAQLDEVRASRARIVAAGDAERRRIERDLHDGVQQRLLGIRLSFRLLRGQLRGDPNTVDDLLTEAEDELAGTLDDLRALARGIHPAVLTDEGLTPALETLSRRAPVPVTVNALPSRALPADVEAAAYFVAAEAIANTAKHAQATAMTITVAPSEDLLVIEISDNGIGGARSATDGGLAGLVDRVAALEGTLSISSPPGRGTCLHAEIPLSR
jgi:signal transduction histidine kinase